MNLALKPHVVSFSNCEATPKLGHEVSICSMKFVNEFTSSGQNSAFALVVAFWRTSFLK